MNSQLRLGTGIAVLVVLSVVAAWLGLQWFRTSGRPSAQGQVIAAEFLTQLRNGEIDAAWSGTTAEFKSFMGRERLEQFYRSHPVLKEPAEFSKFEMVAIGELSLAEYCFVAADRQSVIRVLMAPEQSQWKVERLSVE